MPNHRFAVLVLLAALAACQSPLAVEVPEWPDGGGLSGTAPLTPTQKQTLEGLYAVEQGNGEFGDTLVLKWNGNYLGIYAEKNKAYMIAQAGAAATTVEIEGYWRFAGGTGTGLVRFSTPLAGGTTVRLTGDYGDHSAVPSKPLVIRFLRPIAPALLAKPFYIISHHGSGGAPEAYPEAENSVEIAKVIERYGSNAIEIDVRVSKDGVPFLYHDAGLNWRLTQKGGLIGPAENYTFAQLQAGVRLINGEQIPSLAAFLDTAVTATNLQFIYVDMKPSSVNAMPAIVAVQQAALAKAAARGRNLQIYLAITSDTVFQTFLKQPGYKDIPTICELGIDILEQINSKVWSPRFTQEIPAADINSLHAQGKLAITWTVNVPNFLRQFIDQGLLDGILSDYPGLVAYYYYKQ